MFLLLFLPALTGGERRIQDAEFSSAAAVLKVVEETPGLVLCENMVLVMKAHKEITIEPGIQCFLAKAGIGDQSGFVNMISTHKFGTIIIRTLDNGFWTDAIVEAIRRITCPPSKSAMRRSEIVTIRSTGRDPSGPFVLARKQVIESVVSELGEMKQGFWWEFTARVYGRGFSVREIPVNHRGRAAGQTQVHQLGRLPGIGLPHCVELFRIWSQTRRT